MKNVKNNSRLNNGGYTLIELVLYCGILVLLISMLSVVFGSLFDVQLTSTSTSAVDQDGRYIIAKLTHDVASSSAILVPANPGNQTSTMQITINSINYTYSLDGNSNLQIVNNSTNETNVLNSYNTKVSGLTFTRLGNGDSNDTIQVFYTINSRIRTNIGYESKSFQTTLGSL
jgi:hypothetical protein